MFSISHVTRHERRITIDLKRACTNKCFGNDEFRNCFYIISIVKLGVIQRKLKYFKTSNFVTVLCSVVMCLSVVGLQNIKHVGIFGFSENTCACQSGDTSDSKFFLILHSSRASLFWPRVYRYFNLTYLSLCVLLLFKRVFFVFLYHAIRGRPSFTVSSTSRLLIWNFLPLTPQCPRTPGYYNFFFFCVRFGEIKSLSRVHRIISSVVCFNALSSVVRITEGNIII